MVAFLRSRFRQDQQEGASMRTDSQAVMHVLPLQTWQRIYGQLYMQVRAVHRREPCECGILVVVGNLHP